jgi:Carbohydrate binding domain
VAGGLLAVLFGAHLAAAQGTLATDDGLSMSLSATGGIASLKLAGVEHASVALPSGFAYRELPMEPLAAASNDSFEAGSAGPDGWSWTNNGNGTWTWDTSVAATGSRSMRVDVPGSTDKRSPILTSAAIPIRPNTPYTFSCAVRTWNVSTALNVFLVERDAAGGSIQRGVTSDSGTNDWETRRLTFVSSATAVSASFKVEIYSGHGTAWIDDAKILDLFAGRSPAPFGGSVEADGADLVQTGAADGLALSARFSSVGTALRVDATLSDTTGRDRAVELSFRLPLDAVGWSWEQSPILSLPITAGVRFENLDDAFGAQSHSVYPFATVRSADAAFTLATPMVPQMNRFSYDRSNGLKLTWDVGLSPAAAKTPSQANLTFWIYTQDPRWGLRATAEKYRSLNASDFASPVEIPAGAWVIPERGGTVTSVEGYEDFGWGLLEGVGDIAFGNANELSVLHYVDASGYFRPFPGNDAQPPYDALVAALESDLTDDSLFNDGVPRSEMAQATINSSPHDPNDQYQLFANSYFWYLFYGNRLQIYPVSADADIPAPSMWSVCTKYRVDGRLAWAASRGRIDGIFLDDVSSTFATVENHRRELWAYSDFPLTFSWKTGRVMLFDGFSMAEFCGSFRSYVHDRGLVLMGNLTSGVYSWFGRNFDILGGETRGAEAINSAHIRRLLGAGQPRNNLYVTATSAAPGAADVLAYLRQALLLGYFPGFNGAYWSTPAAYERDRSLFRRYIPLIRTVVAAGWEPVNGATVTDPAIMIERFDGRRGEVFYLTAQNTGPTAKTVTVSLDADTLAIALGSVDVRELVRGKTLANSRTDAEVRFSDTIGAGETFVYRVEGPRSAPLRGRTRRVSIRP